MKSEEKPEVLKSETVNKRTRIEKVRARDKEGRYFYLILANKLVGVGKF